ncbi:uncharacterized protein BO80DRAFT_450441 [Aspergillus ibericus CBS 121593]|uniref:RNA ligase/cyclic nucleotide phosphodiesterase n=1 Tax=Aspergillus ibericus CBS 121593 TaxID=1448316 RepID=A0A395GIC6_9EURO|nr:hypothetical protein BO80DRAFT_450441 [Aspergillus ibericus CBS 121593]RAK95190.1 hypothetical protein BO80DRAFT_450441 [Aspergillus ibericus CBS 121593]
MEKSIQEPNPFDHLIIECQDDPKQIQARYETHRSNRNAQFGDKLLSMDFKGWQIDEILRKLHTHAGADGKTSPFVDPRHNLTLYARPPQHIRDLVAEIQQDVREVASSVWFTPPEQLHMTTLEIASCRPEPEIEGLVSHLQDHGVVPELVDFLFHHRTRLVKPMVSYDATAMALSFVPAAGEETTTAHNIENDGYTYHHLRRDVSSIVTATGLQTRPRYIALSAHITIARFITQDGFVLENPNHAGGETVDHARVAALVERVEKINEKLRQKYWFREDGVISRKGEWLVGEERGLEFCKGTSFYGGGDAVLVGKGFH